MKCKFLLFSILSIAFSFKAYAQCSFTGLNPSYSVCDGATTLVGSPAGGTFFGPGVTGTTFDPAAAGIGTQTIEYVVPTLTYAVATGSFSSVPMSSPTYVTLGDDATSGACNIGFNFSFFGNTYSQFVIASHGFISFDLASPSCCCNGQLLPTGGTPSDLIAGFWEDLNPFLGGLIVYQTFGIAPNRVCCISFEIFNTI